MTKPKKPTKRQIEIMREFKYGRTVEFLALKNSPPVVRCWEVEIEKIEQAIRACMLWGDRNEGKK